MSQDNLYLLWTENDSKFFQEVYDRIKHQVKEQIILLAGEIGNVSPDWTLNIWHVLKTLQSIESQVKWLNEELERYGGEHTEIDRYCIEDLYDTTRDLVRLSKNKAYLTQFGWEMESVCYELQSWLMNFKHAG